MADWIGVGVLWAKELFCHLQVGFVPPTSQLPTALLRNQKRGRLSDDPCLTNLGGGAPGQAAYFVVFALRLRHLLVRSFLVLCFGVFFAPPKPNYSPAASK